MLIAGAAWYSIDLRQPYIGAYTQCVHQRLSYNIMSHVESWLEDGLIAGRAIMLPAPKTVVTHEFWQRTPYTSYPPGAALEAYLGSLYLSFIPVLSAIAWVNLFNQLAVALVLAITIRLSAGPTDRIWPLFAVTAAISYLLHSRPMYWHAMSFAMDTAVTLPFACTLMLELHLRRANAGKLWHFLQAGALMLTAAMDWLGYFLMATLIAGRLFWPITPAHRWHGFLKAGMVLGVGPALVLAFWLLQLHWTHTQELALERFLVRSGAANGWQNDFLSRFKALFMPPAFIHLPSTEIFWLALAGFYFLMKSAARRNDARAVVALVAYVACMAQAYVFIEHTRIHRFAELKFVFLLCLVVYGLFPYSLAAEIRQKSLLTVFLLLYPCEWALLLYADHMQWKKSFCEDSAPHMDLSQWIRQNAADNNVFISPVLEAQPPTVMQTLLRYPVYQFESLEMLEEFLHSAPEEVKFLALMHADDPPECIKPAKVRTEGIRAIGEWRIVPFGKQAEESFKRCLLKR